VILRADARTIPLADESVDSIVTDPPYELGFMGKKWDSSGVAYSVDVWTEALRVLKPGGHLLAFGGSRTYHRLACAIEDAGFEIRDQIQWIYGSGFPKSHNVGLRIDKMHGAPDRGHRIAVANRHHPDGTLEPNGEKLPAYEAKTEQGEAWVGWGTALKPAHEPIVVARKPLGESTVAENVLAHGTGAINVDGCRVEIDPKVDDPRLGGKGDWSSDKMAKNVYEGGYAGERVGSSVLGRWPANVIHDGSEEVVRLFPNVKAGVAVRHRSGGKNCHSETDKPPMADMGYADSGSAARFFYVAKASKTDRGEGNNHPTVKPTDLMRYLCRLVTPPGGIILDPFAGSGSTLRGAFLEGFKSIGIELDAGYCRIARGRMNLLTPAMAGLMG